MNLPDDVIPIIQSFLTRFDFVTSRLVSKAWIQPHQELREVIIKCTNKMLPFYVKHILAVKWSVGYIDPED